MRDKENYGVVADNEHECIHTLHELFDLSKLLHEQECCVNNQFEAAKDISHWGIVNNFFCMANILNNVLDVYSNIIDQIHYKAALLLTMEIEKEAVDTFKNEYNDCMNEIDIAIETLRKYIAGIIQYDANIDFSLTYAATINHMFVKLFYNIPQCNTANTVYFPVLTSYRLYSYEEIENMCNSEKEKN